MKLSDLEPCDLSFYRRPQLGVAFNCPGDCCADARAAQEKAREMEDAGDPNAAPARHAAFVNQPFRIWVAFAGRALLGEREPGGHTIDKLYTRTGDGDDITIAEDIDRTDAGHALLRITDGDVEVVT